MSTLDAAATSGALDAATLACLRRLCILFGLGMVDAGSAELLGGGWMTGAICHVTHVTCHVMHVTFHVTHVLLLLLLVQTARLTLLLPSEL